MKSKTLKTLGSFFIVFFCFTIIYGCASSRVKKLPEDKLDRTPYYAGDFSRPVSNVGHFPILMDETLLDPRIDKGVMLLLESVMEKMNAHLDSLKASVPLEAIDMAVDHEPYLYVGNVDNSGYRGNMYLGVNDEDFMAIYVIDASPFWKSELSKISNQTNISYFLFITLGISEYLGRVRNVLHHMEVELGTGYSKPISWTIGEYDPIRVLHVKGVLLDPRGNIIRAGAEGIIAQPPSLKDYLEDMKDVVEGEFKMDLFNESNLRSILENQRRDLPGRPFLWEAAIQNLVAQLLINEKILL